MKATLENRKATLELEAKWAGTMLKWAGTKANKGEKTAKWAGMKANKGSKAAKWGDTQVYRRHRGLATPVRGQLEAASPLQQKSPQSSRREQPPRSRRGTPWNTREKWGGKRATLEMARGACPPCHNNGA